MPIVLKFYRRFGHDLKMCICMFWILSLDYLLFFFYSLLDIYYYQRDQFGYCVTCVRNSSYHFILILLKFVGAFVMGLGFI